MRRSCPHPLSLFSLVPYPLHDARAKDVISHPVNSHLVSALPNGTLVIDVGPHIRGQSSTTLATLGRGVDADIYVECPSIAKIQCSFEFNPDTGVVMLCDRSFANSTQVSGENAMPFEQGRIRKVLIQKSLNTIIGMGGERRNLIQFTIKWHSNPTPSLEAMKLLSTSPYKLVENPRLAGTVYEAPTELPSRRETRLHTTGQRQMRMRYVRDEEKLGSGKFGTVYKAIDVDTGNCMAVKVLQRPPRTSKQEDWRISLHYALKREVEILSNIKHPHIVEYIASQGWAGSTVEIFMGLKEGTLECLVENGADVSTTANNVFPQMLSALDCIASKGIIHRDVKPENILYTRQPAGQYLFQLGDFGLCNRAVDATTSAGSHLYMAPEMFQGGTQTPKVDVWSLSVTMLWVLNTGDFRTRSARFGTIVEAQRSVLSAASSKDSIPKIREMAVLKPEERASAAQMLVKYFDGSGLSTPRDKVPELTSRLSPSLSTRTSQTKPTDSQKNANLLAAAQHSAREFHYPSQA